MAKMKLENTVDLLIFYDLNGLIIINPSLESLHIKLKASAGNKGAVSGCS